MSGEDYVYFRTNEKVLEEEIIVAISFQEADMLRHQKVIEKQNADNEISKMTITVSTGKEFDATDIARINMMSAVMSASFMQQDSTVWRLANNSEVTVTVAELSEAVAKALEKFGQLKGIV
jgi:hypothetical protein